MTQIVAVQSEAQRVLKDAGKLAIKVHGSAYVGPYVFGTTRHSTTANHAAVVRLDRADYSAYDTVQFPYTTASGVASFHTTHDVLCVARGKLIVPGAGDNTGGAKFTGVTPNNFGTTKYWALFEVDPVSLQVTERFRWYDASNNYVEVLVTDGDFLYLTTERYIHKVSLDTWTLVKTRNTVSPSFPETTDWPQASSQLVYPHSGVYDGTTGHLYLASGSGNASGSARYVCKYRTSDLVREGRSGQIPRTTDDMTQAGAWLFCGAEEMDNREFGFDWGAMAVRKADMQVFPLPRLSASEVNTNAPITMWGNTTSYASLVFGTYLVDLKTNKRIYVLDISNPAAWSLAADVAQIVLVEATYPQPSDPTTQFIANDIVIDETGRFHAFMWSEYDRFQSRPTDSLYSAVMRFTVPGFSFLSPPAILTAVPQFDRDLNTALLRGEVTDGGGAPITERGFYFGTTNPPTGREVVAGTSLGAFSLAKAALSDGPAYYFRAFAVNSVGESTGAVRSFDVNPEPGVLQGYVRKFSDNSPVAGARVVVVRQDTNAVASSGLTDAAGKYRLTGLPSGVAVDVYVRQVGFTAVVDYRTVP